MKSYRDLKVWQKSMKVTSMVYVVTKDFPKEEIYGLTQQIRRSAISIPSNIAEGYGRFSSKDYKRFLLIARGSLFEFQTQLELAVAIGYISESNLLEISLINTEIEKMLNSLIKKIGDSACA
jgi:four helix bundle protein